MASEKYTKEVLQKAVSSSRIWADVCANLGIRPAGGNISWLKKKCEKFEISFTHFKGQAWSKGQKQGPKRPVEYYLTKNSTAKSHHLKVRLIREGIKDTRCERCNLTEWCQQPIPLELHHINGVHSDNRLENLRILCPNCHAIVEQTNEPL